MKTNNNSPFRPVIVKSIANKLTHGTSRIGKLESFTPSQLIKVFGSPIFRPEDSGDGKVKNEWVIRYTPSGSTEEVIFTIYDWKSTYDPMDNPDEQFNFHVGGNSKSMSHYDEFVNSVNDVVYS